jgi:hypothetical protein
MGMPDDEVIAVLRECNPRCLVSTTRPGYQQALELGLIEAVPRPAGEAETEGSAFVGRTDDGRDYLLWARSFESVG